MCFVSACCYLYIGCFCLFCCDVSVRPVLFFVLYLLFIFYTCPLMLILSCLYVHVVFVVCFVACLMCDFHDVCLYVFCMFVFFFCCCCVCLFVRLPPVPHNPLTMMNNYMF